MHRHIQVSAIILVAVAMALSLRIGTARHDAPEQRGLHRHSENLLSWLASRLYPSQQGVGIVVVVTVEIVVSSVVGNPRPQVLFPGAPGGS
jgi:hypothetical protein